MTKYIAKHAGQIIGVRTTQGRKYTHAIIVQDVEEAARAAAYGRSTNNTDSGNFEYNSFIAKQQPGVACRPHGFHLDITYAESEIAAAKIRIEGGFDGYARRLRETAIATFEARKTKGFKPFIAAWAGSLRLAQKAAASHTSVSRALVAIVEAEEVIKPVKAPVG